MKEKEIYQTIPPGRYCHYKGRNYEVIGTARHSETLEPLVVYRALYGERGLWVRPAAMWSQLVETGGGQAPRFAYQGDTVSWLWWAGERKDWERALSHYDELVKDLALEQRLRTLDPAWVESMDPEAFYQFLYSDYFVWKYTAANRLATARAHLRRCREEGGLCRLEEAKRRLFARGPEDIRAALETVRVIPGLGTAGASGLLAVLFPDWFGTVDRFVVENLQKVDGLPAGERLARMRPQALTVEDGVVLEKLLREKAWELDQRFGGWTPRKVDMVLWSFGRQKRGGNRR